jgi:hypothetical protein
MRILFLLAPAPLLLGGCVVQQVARTAVDVVSIPVAVVSEGVDAVTTSQAEADRRRGRRIREEEERLGREARRRERERAREERRAADEGREG